MYNSNYKKQFRSEGVFIIISHAQPSYRLGYLQKQDYKWNVTVKTVKRPMLGIVGNIFACIKINLYIQIFFLNFSINIY